MAVPQAVLDGLNKVSGDFDTLQSDESAQTVAGQALATAQHSKDVADAAVVNDGATLDADKTALKQLIDSSFPSPTPPPPPPAPAAKS